MHQSAPPSAVPKHETNSIDGDPNGNSSAAQEAAQLESYETATGPTFPRRPPSYGEAGAQLRRLIGLRPDAAEAVVRVAAWIDAAAAEVLRRCDGHGGGGMLVCRQCRTAESALHNAAVALLEQCHMHAGSGVAT